MPRWSNRPNLIRHRIGCGLMMRFVGLVVLLFLPALVAQAEPTPPGPRVGEAVEIRRESRSASKTNDGGSSSSFDRDTLTERVLAVRENGLELEYDLPRQTTAGDRARQWKFPVRVFKPSVGHIELLNSAELEARADAWLKAAKISREACGNWGFSWTAFRLDCDPQSVLETLAAFDMRAGDLREGAAYQIPRAFGSATLKKTPGGAFVAKGLIDPDKIRRERAETDRIVAEISGEPLTFEAALQARSEDQISGAITVTLETDAAGVVRRRTTVTIIEVAQPNGSVETSTIQEVLERRALPAARGERGTSR